MKNSYIKEQVSKFKSGQLQESVNDGVIISEAFYDIREPCFMVHESFTLDGKRKFFINSNFIKENGYDDIENFIDDEYNTFNRFFDYLTDYTIDVNKMASLAALCNVGKSPMDIAESILPIKKLLPESFDEFKQILAENIKYYNSFNTFSTDNLYLDEGLIKVPQKTLSFIEELIDVLIYQWAVNSVYDESAYTLMKEFLNSMGLDLTDVKMLSDKIMGTYTTFDKNAGFNGSVDIKILSDDVPYPMEADFIPLSIIFDENVDAEGVSDELNGRPIIILNTKSITQSFKKHDVLNNPMLFTDSSFIGKIKQAKDEIMSSAVHELMHVMQHTIFAQNEFDRGVRSPTSIQKGDGDYDDYITAQVEFDPSISDVVYNFKRMVNGLEEYLETTFDQDVKKELLKKYLGSGYVDSVPEYFNNKGSSVINVVNQVFKPPYFVTKIQDKRPEKYPKMVKKIYAELGM